MFSLFDKVMNPDWWCYIGTPLGLIAGVIYSYWGSTKYTEDEDGNLVDENGEIIEDLF